MALPIPAPASSAFFRDRAAAGEALGKLLSGNRDISKGLALALPRGGVPVGAAVAEALRLPLDILVVRKIGYPGNPEYAMGAIASGGIVILNEGIDPHSESIRDAWQRTLNEEKEELSRREKMYRGNRKRPDVKDKAVIIVDDGLATGATMAAAVQSVNERGAEKCVVAVPVASEDARNRLQQIADEVVCVAVPPDFGGVGRFYDDFSQTTDEEVIQLLKSQPWTSHEHDG